MKESYDDIKSRIPEEPSWYDENGTPRYGKFVVSRCPNIYSDYVGLFRISCQACGQMFDVQMSSGIFSTHTMPSKWHYGDPPIHGCVGDTMNCNDHEVTEFWVRTSGVWERAARFEGAMDV